MKLIGLFLGLTLMLGTLQTHAQPQWRFHLAFEDATGAKDTLWFIYDTTATLGLGNVDTHLGEGAQPMAPGTFKVWTINGVGDSTKTKAWPYTMFPSATMDIGGGGYTPPLTLRWDTSLFSSPDLPSTPTSYIRYAGLFSYYFWLTGTSNFGTEGFDMLLVDSVVIESQADEWLFTPYLTMIFGYSDPTGAGIGEHILPSLDIFPNPAQGRIVLNAPEPLTEILLLDAVGRVVQRVAPPGIGPVEVDVSGLPAGSYFVHARGRAGMYRGRVVVE